MPVWKGPVKPEWRGVYKTGAVVRWWMDVERGGSFPQRIHDMLADNALNLGTDQSLKGLLSTS